MNGGRSAFTGPTLDTERGFLQETPCVIGVDEVGRGALAGPVCMGAVCVGRSTLAPPAHLADSKALGAEQRQALIGPITAWCSALAVGWASAADVDAWGIVAALRQAALRALSELACDQAIVLLDGRDDYITAQPTLAEPHHPDPLPFSRVVTKVKADSVCASVAAASIIAKCARDAEMKKLAATHPYYAWDQNAGYGTAGHRAAIAAHGTTAHHRVSWRLNGGVVQAPRHQAKDEKLNPHNSLSTSGINDR